METTALLTHLLAVAVGCWRRLCVGFSLSSGSCCGLAVLLNRRVDQCDVGLHGILLAHACCGLVGWLRVCGWVEEGAWLRRVSRVERNLQLLAEPPENQACKKTALAQSLTLLAAPGLPLLAPLGVQEPRLGCVCACVRAWS